MKFFIFLLLAGFLLSAAPFSAAPAQAQAPDSSQTLNRPPPVKTGGLPLNEALAGRHSQRSFQSQALTDSQLSQILWAAFGINRDDSRRTIPTARNQQNLMVYAVLENGVWLYDGAKHQLTKALDGNFLSEYGGAPLTLLYAVPDSDGIYGGTHAGSAYQNAGLYCASENLANVVKLTGADKLKGKLKLPDGWQVIIVQSVGRPG
ncbi:MAG: nitroreductase family protein [Deltaproteobacteria bacterium]|jgi:hypothetical protein|nr:nitroreductase family protein [Deltaproteobacteria bacterium]